ncbi:uncharacterized protein V1510DRAFT_370902 [Dipodascopsis tothii]|uniref:uncharacterized protein n=1 Tax=Dipodascopsis tothii TaxID=44089 RepID=UPI0034CF2483
MNRRYEDDIAYYEHKLGIKHKKKGKRKAADSDDDFNFDFLDSTDSEAEAPKKAKSEVKAPKKGKAPGKAPAVSSDDDEDDEDDEDDDEDVGFDDDDDDDDDVDEDDDDERGGDDDDNDDDQSASDEEPEETPRVKENPYVPPTTAPVGKYIPPSLRKKMLEASSESEEVTRLRRQCQGLLNRLSEANIGSIVDDLVKIYAHNPRQTVSEVLARLIIDSTAGRATLLEGFVIVHAALVAALFRRVGLDFGAYFVQTLVLEFDKFYASPDRGKECANLMVLLSQLYTFQVVACGLIYDFIRLFLKEITELHTELLLRLIQNCGTQLRHDDPSSLKDIILQLQEASQKLPTTAVNPRTKFLIETVTSLRNNRLTTSSTATESITRMRKYLGNIVKTADAMRVTLDDIHNVETRGRWWLVGAAWAGSGNKTLDGDEPDADASAMTELLDTAEPDWLALAREQRMNTTVRSAVFVAIMGAEDYVDACGRLMKLKLRRVQEREIARVLLHCCGSEKTFNPYYAFVAGTLCKQHSIKMTFQFALWDLFKELDHGLADGSDSESDGDGGEFDERFHGRAGATAEPTRAANLARFYAMLVAEGHLGLAVLKNVNFLTTAADMNLWLARFFRALVARVCGKHKKDRDPFERDHDLAQLVVRAKASYVLLKGIEFFLKSRLRDIAVPENKAKKGDERGAKRLARETADLDAAVDVLCDTIDKVARPE